MDSGSRLSLELSQVSPLLEASRPTFFQRSPTVLNLFFSLGAAPSTWRVASTLLLLKQIGRFCFCWYLNCTFYRSPLSNNWRGGRSFISYLFAHVHEPNLLSVFGLLHQFHYFQIRGLVHRKNQPRRKEFWPKKACYFQGLFFSRSFGFWTELFHFQI
jgi:hypothetical protein